MRSLYYIIPILMLTACATQTFIKRDENPTAQRDLGQCQAEAMQAVPFVGQGRFFVDADRREYVTACMQAKGYALE